MLSKKMIGNIAHFVADSVKSAEYVLNDKETPISILRIDVSDSLVKVYTNASTGKGTITDIRLLDEEGEVLISKPNTVIKDNTFGLVSTFYIQITERESLDPVNIFSSTKESEGDK